MGEHPAGNSDNTGQNEVPGVTESPSRSANQVREEPIPASHHEQPRQAAVKRNEESAAISALPAHV